MKIAFYGSSLVSSYWNGAATYYRGIIRQLHKLGHQVTFYEPNVYDRQKHRDICPPEWCRSVVYDGTTEALKEHARKAAKADVVVKTSGVGFEDEALFDEVFAAAHPQSLKIFWDVDAPATLSEMRSHSTHPLHRQIPEVDLVLTYGGGKPVIDGYHAMGARECIPIYNALDPDTHHPVRAENRFTADLSFLGNRLPDREARVEQFFFDAAEQASSQRFILGGSGWGDKAMPSNIRYIGHVPTKDHNAFNVTPKAVLNISRESMAQNGYSPATRVFEAAGAGACLITDSWEGLDMFLKEGEEVLAARDGQEVAEILQSLTDKEAKRIGENGRRRILREHTYAHRAAELDRILKNHLHNNHIEAAE
ncbi:CgeB family protein [Nitratireductor basaltis]|uniref:Spore protein YkvP/CgeB glycosyl transferase-like domain-containing protein n=1 Tax=Nitratireductor basaltis TaxID=472175 RepID=A0A084UAT7_9HYPH|nr:glycosyltransferase [Nitratireductor basaltis]KFB10073.1 hypothetical protein EL18_01102 [Nitratireductor basaltis]